MTGKQLTTYIRQSIWSLESPNMWDPVTTGYAKAVSAMRARADGDPTSWSYQAAMHGSYLTPPAHATWNQCQHGTWYFLPWHRMYLYWFERIVRAAAVAEGAPADWALPYWNYGGGSPANQLPPAFRQPTWNPGSGAVVPNPLYTAARNANPDINAGAGLPDRVTSFSGAYGYSNFTGDPLPGFGGPQTGFSHDASSFGALEAGPHNPIHVLVGGDATFTDCSTGWMADPNCAAMDPIFWIHHANIDRLWSNWIAPGTTRVDPSDSKWTDFQFTFYDETGQAVTMRAADVIDTLTQLGYEYDDRPALALAVALAPQAPQAPQRTAVPATPRRQPPRLVAATEAAVQLRGQRTDVTVSLPPPAQDAIESATGGDAGGYVYLNVEGLDSDRIPGVAYEVHVDLPSAAQPGGDDDSFVGLISFFGFRRSAAGQADSPNHPLGPMTHTFDITGRVQDLRRRGLWNQEAVSVSFVPIGLEPPPGTAGTAHDAQTGASPRVGRISISYH
jgi:hypothetical protein